MFNPNAIILGLFVIAGFIVALWGWLIIAKARKTQRWPMVEGTIEQSAPSSADDPPSHLLFSYTVAAHTYQRVLESPGGDNSSPELAADYAEKHPVGTKVPVYYNPDQPDQSTLEPSLASGDWMVLALGITTMVFGIFALFFGNYT